MQDTSPHDIEFLKQLNARIEENIPQEQFGVSELADLMNMSRSNLLRKVKKATNLSVSQLINQVRLRKAMELLRSTPSNVSEVAQQVGFSSPSYFIKCFRERYGYPPGEAAKRASEPEVVSESVTRSFFNKGNNWLIAAVIFVAVSAFVGWYFFNKPSEVENHEKSIVVLPFKNDSGDSTNLYLINGLMEATLNNLQRIKDLRVLSRTSAEKFRNSPKTIKEMAAELKAGYFVEGSGQKIGNRIVLTVQLIDGHTDRHLWSKQYRRETDDIFKLQQEISKDIAEEIRVVITPEEKNRIEKIPTRNKEAYDVFLKGRDLMKKMDNVSLTLALGHFQKAIEKDSSFALAYAHAAMACFNLDFVKKDQDHIDLLGNYADKALLYDSKLAESLTAKALYYLAKKEFTQVPVYLEKALEYNPNSTDVLALLTDFYGLYLPDTGKYLEYALKGLQLGGTSADSVQVSYFYLRLGNALVQAGFVDESLYYIDKSVAYYPLNPFSRYVRAFVLCAKGDDLRKTRDLLIIEQQKDPDRLDILKDIGKISYYLREYQEAYEHFKILLEKQESMGIDMFSHEAMIIGVTYDKIGKKEEGKQLKDSYRQFLMKDESSYNNLGWAMYYAYEDNQPEALKHLQLFTNEDNIQYWVILFLETDPMLDKVKDRPEFKKAFAQIAEKFWKTNARLEEELKEKGVGEFLSN